MTSSSKHGTAHARNAKEFAQFCRVHEIFMVDGLEVWRAALKAKGTPEGVINEKLSSAARFIRTMGDHSPKSVAGDGPLHQHGG